MFQTGGGLGGGNGGGIATKVVCLTEVVTADELKDDEEYEDILEDMRVEGGKFGTLMFFWFLYTSFCPFVVAVVFLFLCFVAFGNIQFHAPINH